MALAAPYDGMSRAEAAKVGGRDRQTLRDWAHRFNEQGPDGLKHRSGGGRPRLLTHEQMSELSAIVETGPDPEVDGVVRWRRIDLKRVIEERFGVMYSERTISDPLAALQTRRSTTRRRSDGDHKIAAAVVLAPRAPCPQGPSCSRVQKKRPIGTLKEAK